MLASQNLALPSNPLKKPYSPHALRLAHAHAAQGGTILRLIAPPRSGSRMRTLRMGHDTTLTSAIPSLP